MTTSKRKVRKFRGSRTNGFGRVGQHRKAGQHGGKGQAGMHKYHYSWVIRYNPTYFGKNGFRSPQHIVTKTKILNIAEIENSLDTLMDKKIARQEGNQVLVNLIELGVTKVLGNGNISRPLVITAPSFSKTAIKKIQEAGGSAVIPNA
jgi:large subunit ribosomal protein L15